MTRKKVKLAFIVNDSARKATFKKRKKGLMKKVSELSTLCGIDVCAIVFSPYDPQPDIWPPSPLGVQRVLAKFRGMPELEQSKKMVNQESFLRQRIFKAKEQLKKQRKDNREKEITQLMFQCINEGKILCNLNTIDLNDLAWLIDHNLKEINRRIEVLTKKGQSQAPMLATPLVTNEVIKIEEKEQEQGIHCQGLDMNMDFMQKQNWFVNLMDGTAENETQSFGDVNHQSGIWHNNNNPFFH